jgi:hypothetical protein
MNPNAVLGIAGGILVVLAVLLQFGVVPSPASIAGCGTPSCGTPALTASFSWSVSGPTLTVTDVSYANDVAPTVNFSWGDGGVSNGLKLGATASHSYHAIGTYVVTETVQGFVPVYPYKHLTSSATLNIPVATTGTSGGTIHGNGTASQSCVGSVVSYCAYLSGGPFTATVNGTTLAATFTDATTEFNMRLVSLTWTFGDGTTSGGTLGGSIIHAYAVKGTYSVTENLTLTGTAYPNTAVTWTKNYVESVAVGTPTPTNSTGTGSPVNGYAVVTAVIGAAFLLSIVAPGATKVIVIVGGAVVALGILTFTVAGGVL